LPAKYNTDNHYTTRVKELINLVYPKKNISRSFYGDAKNYYLHTQAHVAVIKDLQSQLKLISPQKHPISYQQTREKLKAALDKLESDRIDRLTLAQDIVTRLLSLCEGDSHAETQIHSAKFLATMLLITRGAEDNFPMLHKRLKPLYKAVLALRLFDAAISKNVVESPELIKYEDFVSRFDGIEIWKKRWESEIATPIILASLVQDIGLIHPEAQYIVRGPNNDKNEFRLLPESERKALLKINFQHTLDYIKYGLGEFVYRGDDKTERDNFVITQKQVLAFSTHLIRDAYVGKGGMGDFIKIPQIYASVIFSTKSSYTHKELPNGYLLIEQLAKKGLLNSKLADCFINIVGYFPMGFGICFTPKPNENNTNQYEFAIVTQLNPKHPAEPHCRTVSKQFQFITAGQHIVVKRGMNLFFKANRSKIQNIDKQRLHNILGELSNGFTPDAAKELIPSFWQPYNYFADKKHQNLWTRS
jgi:hypothetical protein